MPHSDSKLNAFPVFLRVERRWVVIVGAGDEALAKARLIAQSSADILIVAELPSPELAAWGRDNDASLIAEPYSPAHLSQATLVFAASGDAALDARVSAERPLHAEALGRDAERRRRRLVAGGQRKPAD